MARTEFWRESKVAVLGGGSWGLVLAQIVARNCGELTLWVRKEEDARQIGATRAHARYHPELVLDRKIRVVSEIDRAFEGGIDAIIWAVPSSGSRELARSLAARLDGSEVVLHATKGVEQGTLKRMSQVLREELPCLRIGAISGPNLAHEIARGEPAATVVASKYVEVARAGQELLASDKLRVYPETDIVGVEWAGTLKNVFAIAAGALDELGLGWNTRAMLISRGLAEMVRFGAAMGGTTETFLGLAGIGDLLATCSSPLSRNYRVGARLAKGENIAHILETLGSTAEGVRTAQSVWAHARARKIEMPITEGVCRVIQGEATVTDMMQLLMKRPAVVDRVLEAPGGGA